MSKSTLCADPDSDILSSGATVIRFVAFLNNLVYHFQVDFQLDYHKFEQSI